MDRQSGILVIVHSALFFATAVWQPSAFLIRIKSTTY
jgi:hypothetical protein